MLGGDEAVQYDQRSFFFKECMVGAYRLVFLQYQKIIANESMDFYILSCRARLSRPK